MDIVDLLAEARRAGLRVHAEAGRLIVRGPKTLEPLARQILERKSEVMRELEGVRPNPPPCALCGRQKFQIAGRRPRCVVCDGPFPVLAGPEAAETEEARP